MDAEPSAIPDTPRLVEVSIVLIIEMAEEFRCCPDCGSVDVDGHSCLHCRRRFTRAEDALWFAEFLRAKYGIGRPKKAP